MEAAFLEFSPGSSLSLVANRDWRRLSNGRLICLPKPRSQTARVRNVLFSEGDPANEVFEIVKGAVAVMRSLSGGRRQILDVVGPGHMVGFTARRLILFIKLLPSKHSPLSRCGPRIVPRVSSIV